MTTAQKPRPLKPNLFERIAQVERDYVEAALRDADGNVAQAARLLGISRGALDNKLRKYGYQVVVTITRKPERD